MARMKKNSRNITVRDVPYRWRATGTDGGIDVTIWPSEAPGPTIETNFHYGTYFSRKNATADGVPLNAPFDCQVIITNRIIKRVIDYAIDSHNYDPECRGKVLSLRWIEHFVDTSDAERARYK